MSNSKFKQLLGSSWRVIIIVVGIAIMFFVIGKMALSKAENVSYGKADLTKSLQSSNQTVELNGLWSFYFGQLLTPEDFRGEKQPENEAWMKVPGSWEAGNNTYANQGVATYRLVIRYPSGIADPGLRIQNIACAYKLYVDGQWVAEVGKVSDQRDQFSEGTQLMTIDLPKDKQEVELIFQVANWNYAKGGIRQSPVFGSKYVLERQHTVLMALQLIFIGGVLIFGVYYLLLFILQTQNKTALIFSILCFVTGVRSLIWGEVPIMIFYPNISFESLAYINYITGFNIIPLMVLFITSLYPLEYKKNSLLMVLFPILLFDCLLLTNTSFMSRFTNYLYLVMLVQMSYMMYILIRAVLNKRETAPLMYIAVCGYVLAVNLDILHFSGMSGFYDNNMFLWGNVAVIIAMSYAQAKQQAKTHEKLVRYNQNLLDADQLKDKIMATEMSFLHAQIKPHFLYNALDAIANVCEKDGKKAGKLIIDLAIYLRGSLEFNHLDKMSTIEKELEFADKYFNIEQARFGEKIQLIKVINDSNFQLPVLILQPLVENAVRHGIAKKTIGGTVWITIEAHEDEMRLEVRDDGVGISENQLKMILANDSTESGVGLINIHHRLLRLYGKGLVIESDGSSWTSVKFAIPRYTSPIRARQKDS